MTDEEILSLEKIVIKDNKKIKDITFELGIMGAGNTNTSSYSIEEKRIVDINDLKDKSIYFFNPFEKYSLFSTDKIGIAAIIDDEIYLIVENNYSKVKKVEKGKSHSFTQGVAYDTFACYYIFPVE